MILAIPQLAPVSVYADENDISITPEYSDELVNVVNNNDTDGIETSDEPSDDTVLPESFVLSEPDDMSAAGETESSNDELLGNTLIQDGSYEFDYELTAGSTIIIKKIKPIDGQGNGEIVIPETIDGHPVSGFAEDMLDECRWLYKVTNNATVKYNLPSSYEYIWLNEDFTDKVESISTGQSAFTQIKYNIGIDFETIKNSDGIGPVLICEYFDEDGCSSDKDLLGKSVVKEGGVSWRIWFDHAFRKIERNESGDVTYYFDDHFEKKAAAGFNIYLDKKYSDLLRKFIVKSYEDYPIDADYANTDSWGEMMPNPVEGESITNDFLDEDGDGNYDEDSPSGEEYIKYTYYLPASDIEKYNHGTYAIGIEVKYGEPGTFVLKEEKDKNGNSLLSYEIQTDNLSYDNDRNAYVYSGSGDVKIKLIDSNACLSAGFYQGRNIVIFKEPNGVKPKQQYYSGVYYTAKENLDIVTIPESEMKAMEETGISYTVSASYSPSLFPSYVYLYPDTSNNRVSYVVNDYYQKRQEGAYEYFYFKDNTNSVKLKPKSEADGTKIMAMSCQMYKARYVNGKLVTEAFGATEKLSPDDAGEYTIDLSSKVSDSDFEGQSIWVWVKPIINESSELTISFNSDNSLYKGFIESESEEGFDDSFDLNVRVDSGTYKAVWDKTNKKYKVSGIPAGSTAVVTVVPKADCLHTVTHAKITDSTNNTGFIKAGKTGEFTVKVGNLASTSLDLYTEPVKRIVITDVGDNPLTPVSNKYSVKYNETFKAKLVTSMVVEREDGIPILKEKTVEGTTFKNGSNSIDSYATEGVLTATPIVLGTVGKTLTLNVTCGKEDYKATLICSANPAKADVAGFKTVKDKPYKEATQLFDTDKSYKVTFTNGTDLQDIEAHLVTLAADNNPDKGTIIDFGEFDKTKSTLNITAEKILSGNYEPGSDVLFAFYDNDSIIGGVNRIVFTNPLGGKTPKVSVNKNTTTAYDIGLNLSLPSGVKASPDMYYRVTLTADAGDEDSNLKEDDKQYYENTVTKYIPSSEKAAVIDVTTNTLTVQNKMDGIGWSVGYFASVDLGFYKDLNDSNLIGDKTSQATVATATNAPAFETKLSLTKKAPSKIYNGQNDILAAIVKYSNATTIRRLGEVRLYAADGREIDRWNGYGNTSGDSEFGYLRIDNDAGSISVNTKPSDYFLSTGKYTIQAYAAGGGGKVATANVQINVVNSIGGLEITPEVSRLYKPFNKKVTFKTPIKYYNLDNGTAVDTKKVTWSITDKNKAPLSASSPLYGKVTVANGNVSIDAKLLVGDNSEDYSFCIKAQAADYQGNSITVVSDPITITSIAQVPTYMGLAWDSGNMSRVAEGGTYLSNDFMGTKVLVYDQNFELMDESEYTLKLTGLLFDSNNRLYAKSAGNATITATSTDGGKKSCKRSFKVAYTGTDYALTTLVQDISYTAANDSEYEDKFYDAFINAEYDDDKTLTHIDNSEVINKYPAGKPFYVYIAGCYNVAGAVDYSINALIDHKLSVTGGKIASTDYNVFEQYVRYTVVPSAPTTNLTVTNNTKGINKNDKTKVINVTNSGISSVNAPKITADKKSIINYIYDIQQRDTYDQAGNLTDREFRRLYADPDVNPNRVTYSIDKYSTYKLDGKTLVVNIITDDIKPGDTGTEAFAGYLGLGNKADIPGGVYRVTQDGKFVVDFWDVIQETRKDKDDLDVTQDITVFRGVNKGNYTFWATVGKANVDGSENVTDFEPLAKPTQITVKVDEVKNPNIKFATGSISLGNDGTGKLPDVTVTNGLGINRYFLTGVNSKGVINGFDRIFVLDENNKIKIRDSIDDELSTELGHILIGNGKSAISVQINSLSDLNALRTGKLKDSAGKLYGTAAQQSTAYKNWVKTNCTGYIGYEAFRQDGSVADEGYASITVNIDGYLSVLEGVINQASFDFPLNDDEFKVFGFTAKQARYMTDDTWQGWASDYGLEVSYNSPDYNASKNETNGRIKGSISYIKEGSLPPEYPECIYEKPNYDMCFSPSVQSKYSGYTSVTTSPNTDGIPTGRIDIEYSTNGDLEYASGYVSPDITYEGLLEKLEYNEFKSKGRNVTPPNCLEGYNIGAKNIRNMVYSLVISEYTYNPDDNEKKVNAKIVEIGKSLNDIDKKLYSSIFYHFEFDNDTGKLFRMTEYYNERPIGL